MFDFKKLHKIQESFSTDSLLHFAYAYIICSLIHVIFKPHIFTAFMITMAIGLFKEYCVDDKFDNDDVIADALGAGTYMAALFLSYL